MSYFPEDPKPPEDDMWFFAGLFVFIMAWATVVQVL